MSTHEWTNFGNGNIGEAQESLWGNPQVFPFCISIGELVVERDFFL